MRKGAMWKSVRGPRFIMSRKRKEERSLLIQRGNDTENGDHEYLDETVSPRGSDINELDTEKRWRTVKIGEPTHIIEIGEGSPNLPETICVFPKGIHLILASNPSKNRCDPRLLSHSLRPANRPF
mgnify:CR=1 FL=1